MNSIKYKYVFILIFVIASLMSIYFVPETYLGSKVLLYIYSLLFFLYLSYVIFYNKIFFNLFLGILLFLGFWLKLIVHIYTENMNFYEGIGAFQSTKEQLDRLLIVISVGVIGFFLATVVSNIILAKYKKNYFDLLTTNKLIYSSKKRILFAILLIIGSILFAAINFYFKIYQRGNISQISSFAIRGFFAWGLLFGFATLVNVFVLCEFKNNRGMYLAVFVALTEALFSSVSLLSRGFILNSSAFLLALFIAKFKTFRQNASLLLFSLVVSLFYFYCSLKIVSSIRYIEHVNQIEKYTTENVIENGMKSNVSSDIRKLIVDRWVGLEGVMATSTYSKDRFEAFINIWKEKPAAGTSYYDREVSRSAYYNTVSSQQSFVTLPGFIGWIALLNRLDLLLFACLSIGIFCAGLEIFASIWIGNIFTSALIGQVMAFRISHFGYLPSQSYQLFFSLFATILVLKCFTIITKKYI